MVLREYRLRGEAERSRVRNSKLTLFEEVLTKTLLRGGSSRRFRSKKSNNEYLSIVRYFWWDVVLVSLDFTVRVFQGGSFERRLA